ncbi:alpha/beta-hydrolase [Hypoxylon trugodes]|uniref:alpha/beta-hydrolase n=1 Tax=Hypoxylon trugodes TaxID=326681 RepID=UPI00219BE941|nr:alpha/beta-hydrolase [Hypoxylon trugodes]KAI1390874.1 alpha/beta-hydrolase [Hypoxylon trugodes]
MLKLNSDDSFNFELLRVLAHTTYGGADISECLIAAQEIVPGDFESWYEVWYRRAERVLSQAKDLKNPVSIRDAMFRAATYSRAADFFLHGNWDDPRIDSLWKRQTECFDAAIATLDNPGYRKLVKADGFNVPIIVFPAGKVGDDKKRPTILLGNGMDGSMGEMYHMHGVAALERGYNVVVYDGPGQPSVRREQGLGFIHNWEAVVTPVVDFLETLPFVDAGKIGLVGYSMGGYLAARAAAFEHRLAAVFQIDGLYDFTRTPIFQPENGLGRFGFGDDLEGTQALLNNPKVPAGLRWVLGQGLWAFKVRTRSEYLEKARLLSLANGIAEQIQCPVLVGDAANDMFFLGQPQMMVEALGEKATLVTLTDEDGAGDHCHFGAARHTNRIMYDWFEEKVVKV